MLVLKVFSCELVNGTGMDLLWILLVHQVVNWVGWFFKLAPDWSWILAGVRPEVRVVSVPFYFHTDGGKKTINSVRRPEAASWRCVLIPVCLMPSAQDT